MIHVMGVEAEQETLLPTPVLVAPAMNTVQFEYF